MSMQKTLGGDRLGSGKKMKVSLHGYERSTHDLGYIWRSTMSAGTLVPFMSEVALPGDTFDINLDCDIKTHPTIGPLFGSYKVQLDVFSIPMRLYNSLLHNNALGIGNNMSQVKLPQLQLQATNVDDSPDIDNSQINPSCILSYLGIRGVGKTTGTPTRNFNAIPYLGYWDIYKNYYANKQEEIGAVIHTPTIALVETVESIRMNTSDGTLVVEGPIDVGTTEVKPGDTFFVKYTLPNAPKLDQIILTMQYNGRKSLAELCTIVYTDELQGIIRCWYNGNQYGTDYITYWTYINNDQVAQIPPRVVTFPLENIDTMRENILAYNSKTVPYVISSTTNLAPYQYPLTINFSRPNALNSQEGLAIKTYQSDLFNNWLSTEWIDGEGGITEITSIDTSGGSFSLDTLNLSKKVYDMLNRIAVSGGTYDDWLDAVYTNDRWNRAETPIYMGGLIKELVFQEVVSNAAVSTGEGTQPLGTLAGKGIMGKKHKGGHVVVKVDEPSYIMGIISLTPRVDYSQGNKWDVHLQTMDDLHKPALDEIGFQELITEQMAWWDTTYSGGEWAQNSVGKQPAWINYMTNVNQTRGNFAISDNEMFMTLNRRYEWNGAELADATTYIDPAKFNFIFANTAIDAQNFWAQIAVDITARRKMSAKIMPNL